MIAKLGGVPQLIGAPDIYPALEKGMIDAAEWVGPYDDEKLGFYKVAKYYYYPGWWEGGSMINIFINIDKWNSLPKHYQAIVQQAAAYANDRMVAKYDKLNPPALKRLIAGGTKLHAFSPAIMEACLKAAHELHAEISQDERQLQEGLRFDERLHGAGLFVVPRCRDQLRLVHDPLTASVLIAFASTTKKPRSIGSGAIFLSACAAACCAGGYLKSSGGGSSICGTSIFTLFGSIPVPTPL